MQNKLTVEHLVMLVAILYIGSFMLRAKETFEQTKPRKDKLCGQLSINEAHMGYVFNSPPVPRR